MGFQKLLTQFHKGYKGFICCRVEYEIALELIKARKQSGLTQEEVALRMGTTQSVIARLESGKAVPSIKTLAKYAQATGKHLHLSLV
ncbi:MAG: helix-turn-helix transcriptional regulator [Candidatus Paracaedibacteraceae bacterium]|nr:helix-turn-helix transcriptional regulator [Candidatus Paracaedibacteraceae bacterium]